MGNQATILGRERQEPEWVYLVQFAVPSGIREEMEVFLWEHATRGWQESQEEPGLFIVYCTDGEQAETLSHKLRRFFPHLSPRIHAQRNKQWLTAWREFFTPLQVGDAFRILPSWQDPDSEPSGTVPVFIHPEMAFGTGHHPTTRLCLQAIAELLDQEGRPPARSCLDLGTGSGILAIACAKLGVWTLGLDNDPVALHNARQNRDLNRVSSRLALAVGDLKCLTRAGKYDLVLANILAEPLLEMCGELAGTASPGGYLVLSGLLGSQEPELIRAYSDKGLDLIRTLREEEWSALVWRSR